MFMTNFLLRFEEEMDVELPVSQRGLESGGETAAMGTNTFTKVQHESPDSDPGGRGMLVFPE
jgi:hypothetical protein